MTTVAAAPAVCPVPTRLTVVDPASLVMFSVALLLSPDVGANMTETVVDVPAASVVAPSEPTRNRDATAPAIGTGLGSASGAVPLIAMVTGTRLTLPTECTGHASAAREPTS